MWVRRGTQATSAQQEAKWAGAGPATYALGKSGPGLTGGPPLPYSLLGGPP